MKDGLALEFLLELLSTLKTEKGGTAVVNVVKKSGTESRLMEFFPSVNQQQTEDNFSKTFLSRDLPEIVTFRKAQAAQNTKNSLHRMVREAIEDEKPVKEIILEIKDSMTRTSIQEQDAIVMVCTFLVLVYQLKYRQPQQLQQFYPYRKKSSHLMTSISYPCSQLAMLYFNSCLNFQLTTKTNLHFGNCSRAHEEEHLSSKTLVQRQ